MRMQTQSAPPRVAALLDIENLLHVERTKGSASVQRGLVAVVGQLRSIGLLCFSVACCDWWLAKLAVPAAELAGVRIFAGPPGRDRADGELLRRDIDIPQSVEVVVIGSGDAAFTPLAERHRARGQRVVVLARPGSVARSLLEAADEFIPFALAA